MRPELFDIDTALLTTRCVVRRFREGEGKDLYELVDRNRDILQDSFPYLVADVCRGPERGEIFVRQRIASWLLQEDYGFGIYLTETTELIGFLFLSDLNWDVPAAEVRFFLDRDHAKQGIMTECLARVVRFGFRQLDIEKLYVLTQADNYPSQRVARKVGFGREGDLRNEFRRPGGALVDLVRFGLSRETYGE